MAIKKGAFELYTKERTLPEKKASDREKKNHFFDDIFNEENGSQSVHNRFTNDGANGLGLASVCRDTIPSESSAIDQNPQATTALKTSAEVINNGSQSVHNRFTDTKEVLLNKENLNNKIQPTIKDLALSASFLKLIGNQREIIIALYKNMRINKTNTTEELTLENISTLTGVNQKSLKNTLFRLTSSGILNRVDQKLGRGGWVKYQIHPKIIEEIQFATFYDPLKLKK